MLQPAFFIEVTGRRFIVSGPVAAFWQIRDLAGKKVLAVNNKNDIDVSGLAAGSYFVEAVYGGKKIVEQFIKN